MPKRRAVGRLGDLQLAIMEVLWARNGATLPEIRASLDSSRPSAPTTIATVLNRLERSGLVTHGGGERMRVYRATAPRSDVQRSQTQRFIDRFFGGRPSDLISHLVRESEIDDEELGRLRQMLRQRKRS